MVRTNLSYGPLPEQKLDLYLADAENAPLFVFFHGGGLEGGHKGNGKDRVFLELAANGISAVTADYRMYPTAHFPDFIEDAARCVSWCKDNIPHSTLTVGGSSAGGYLTMMLAFDGRYLAAYGVDCADREQIAGYFADSGQPTVHYNVLRERGLDSRLVRVDEAAPVYFIGPVSDPERLPKYQIIVADQDMVNRPEQNRMLYRTMLHFGYPAEKITFTYMEGYRHVEYNGVTDTDGKPLYEKMIRNFILG